jgi:hypothetical protein
MLEDTRAWGQSKEVIWKVIFTLPMWSIWRERNHRLFKDCKSNVVQLKSSFLRALLDWVISFIPNFSSSNLADPINFLDFRPQ